MGVDLVNRREAAALTVRGTAALFARRSRLEGLPSSHSTLLRPPGALAGSASVALLLVVAETVA
ncbi:MAG TPA: hypothetical protein VEF89_12925 [Solirubrobacteraceae bacterium]|nr:hypothetical protein [Solirubrobacteraceae bacterium]